MEKWSTKLKKFSRENSPEERNDLAIKLKNTRREYSERKMARKSDAFDVQEDIDSNIQTIEDLNKQIEEIENHIRELSKSKIRNFFKIKNLQRELEWRRGIISDAEKSRNNFIKEKETLSAEEKSDDEKKISEARQMLDGFYEQENKKLSE